MPDDRKSPDFNGFLMLWLASSFAAGILAASFADFEFKAALAVCGLFTIVSFLFRSRNFAIILILISFVAAGIFSALIEKHSVATNRLKILFDTGQIRSGDPVEIEGVVRSREPSVDSLFLTLDVDKITHRGREQKVSGNVRLFLPVNETDKIPENFKSEISDLKLRNSDSKFEISDVKYGSRLKIATSLDREETYLNPGVIPKKQILDLTGVDATGSIKSVLLIEKLADESVFLPLAWVYDQRAWMIKEFRDNLSGPASGIMTASLLGNKYFLDKDTADLFREGGTFHILVISGLHITFIGGLLLLFVRQITRRRWVQFLVTMIILWAYTLAVGAEVPVVRAALMFTVLIYSYVKYRPASLLNALALCALILLVWRPSDLFNPSFQLTFVSVAAIVVLAYPLIEKLRRIGTWTPTRHEPFPPAVPVWLKRLCETFYWNADAWHFESKNQRWTAILAKSPFLATRAKNSAQTVARYLFEGVLVSMLVQICMLPLSVVYFHRVAAISVLLNLWVGIFIALESFTAVIAVFVNQISGIIATAFFMFAEIFNWMMLLLPRLFVDNSWASFRLPAYSGYGQAIYFLYFVPVLLLAIALNRWKPFEVKQRSWVTRRPVIYLTVAALGILFAVIIFHPFSSPRPDRRLHVDFLDVGQGDAAFVTFPDGRTMLIDGGGRIKYRSRDEEAEPFEPDVRGIGESVVSEFLWHRGYSRIHFILATHADADHIQGLTDVARNFKIGSAIFGRMPLDDPNFTQLDDILRRRGVQSEGVVRGDVLKIGDVVVEVLNPPADDRDAVSDNDNSIVLRITYGSRTFLLTGDIESRAESTLVNAGSPLTADVIKAAHHGSRTSSTQAFIDAVGPKYAVISVGRSSPYGHPHSEVVERWKAAGADVLTTGERGTISITTDGHDLVIETFINKKREPK